MGSDAESLPLGMEQLNFPSYNFDVRNADGSVVILDRVRQRFVPLTPEEWVRQHLIQYLVEDLDVPKGFIALEASIPAHDRNYRADVVVYDRNMQPVLIAECKNPSVKIKQDVFDQIGLYNTVCKAPYLLVTNGLQHYCCRVDHKNRESRFTNELPSYQKMISSSINAA